MTPHVFSVDVEWSRDRKGMMCSPELKISNNSGCIEVATPPEFPKGIPGIWSPEHLFTAAVSSCLMTTFLAVAENSGLAFRSFRCGSKGTLDQRNGKLAMTRVDLFPEVTLERDADRDRAMKVLQKAEANCLISNSINATVTLTPLVKVVEHHDSPAHST